MRILTLADLHLFDLAAPNARAFFAFLQENSARADLIVLNGDVFDFLVGRQQTALAHYQAAIEQLEAAAAKTKIVYLPGNHDFHLQGVFSHNIHVTETFTMECGGRRFYWQHGDLIGTTRGYRRLRWALRRKLVRRVTEAFPPPLAWRLALLWSQTSRDASTPLSPDDMRAMLPDVRQLFKHGYDVVISGHHHLAYHHAEIENPVQQKEWFGLGPWMDECWYLETIDGRSQQRQYKP